MSGRSYMGVSGVADLLARAVQTLAGVCDGAVRQDGRGFNGPDARFGHALAETDPRAWSAANRWAAHQMLAKYKAQLWRAGIVYEAIPVPEAPPAHVDGRQVKVGRIDLRTNRIVMAAPYDRALVAAQREIPGRRWDGREKVNLFPAQQIGAVLALMGKCDVQWEITPAAQALIDLASSRGHLPNAADLRGVQVDGLAMDVDLGGVEEGSPRMSLEVQERSRSADQWLLRFDYDAAMVAEAREIPTRKWDLALNANVCRCVPDVALAIQQFISRHDDHEVTFEGEAQERLQREAQQALQTQAERQQVVEMSGSAISDFQVEGLGGQLRPFQSAGVEYALAQRRTFIADEQGLGKTVQALAALAATDSFPAIVVCPSSVKLSWRNHVQGPVPGAPQGWIPGRRVMVCEGRGGDIGLSLEPPDVVVVNWDVVGAWKDALIGLEPRALICDESHYAKNEKAQRTEAVLEIAQSLPPGALRLNLSGTPVLNRPRELITQLKILGRLGEFGGYSEFVRRYCADTPKEIDQDGEIAGPYGHLRRLHETLRGCCYVRRLKKDVLKDLPPKQRSLIPVSITNRAEYERAERETIKFLMELAGQAAAFQAMLDGLGEAERAERIKERAQDAGRRAERAEKLVRINALRKIVGAGKITAAKGWVADFLDGGGKLIVFAHHREVQHALLTEFAGAARILGEDGAQDRQAAIERFQEDPECRLMVASMRAAREGITLTAASDVLFLEWGWTPGEHDQAEDRAHRIGQRDSVTCHYLSAEGTIDADMADLIEQKRLVVSAVTEGEAVDGGMSIQEELEERLLAKGAQLVAA